MGPGPLLGAAWWLLLGALTSGLATLLVLGRRNLRLGRGDKKGTVRLAGVLFVSSTLGLMLRADHVPSLLDEWSLVINNMFSQTLLWSVLIWISYLALEPIARRRWPELLISWSRLLAGRFRDPLVGCDVLLGALAGIALALVVHLGVVAPSWFGLPPRAPRVPVLTTLAASRHLGFFFLNSLSFSVFFSLGGLFGLFFYRALLRNRWLALSLQFFLQYVLFAALLSNFGELRSVSAALFTVIWFAVLLRAGLLASVVSFCFFRMLEATPLTLDLSAWYAGRTLLSLGFLGAVLIYGFWVSLGGKSPFGHSLFEGEGEG